ncbi:MAG: ATP-binding protein [bacterium]
MDNNRNQDIAVVGSPSTNTELTLDLLQEATEERLVGALTAFQATQNGQTIVSVGQIVGIELKNRWHEDSVFRNLVKRTGEIPPITNRQDTRTADLIVGATFKKTSNGFRPEVLGMVPSTGTRVSRIDQPLLNKLLESYQSEIFYLGQAYANEILYPMWFKHFGSGVGGAGEAYHLGVFWKTGSGKSGLAKMMLCAYSRHPNLGILIIDPQGEFTLELSGSRVGNQGLALDQIVRQQGRTINVYRIEDIQLDDWNTFEEMLISLGFCEELTITHSDNAVRAAEVVRNALKRATQGGRQQFPLANAGSRDALTAALNAVIDQQSIQYIFPSRDPRVRLQNRVQDILTNRLDEVLNNKWIPLCSLFAAGPGKRRLYGIVSDLMGTANVAGARPVVVIDLSARGNHNRFWTEELERRLLSKLLNVLIAQSTSSLSTRQSANVLVLLDEAHRHAPSGRLEQDTEAERLRVLLRRAVRETRKYGLGWFFISQTLGGLDPEILQQLRILTFGFGLAMGTEFDRLRDFVGGDKRSLELYQSFRDPQSFPDRELQEFPFMAVGPMSPLAFSGKPIFFNMFTDMDKFLQANGMGQE